MEDRLEGVKIKKQYIYNWDIYNSNVFKGNFPNKEARMTMEAV